VAIYDLDVLYAVSNRLAFDVTIPFLSGSAKLKQGTIESHQYVTWQATGLADIALKPQHWLTPNT